jgi:alkylhydroperoxidase/carboxymuconolactone decarboxylase family protein YurZ
MGVIGDLDPQWLDEFLAMGADLYRGVLPAKLVELMATAVDASWTHLYAPGARRHIQGALANGATIEEIMEVLKLSRALGVDACELGAPILAEELAAYQQQHWPGHPIAEGSGQPKGGRSWRCRRGRPPTFQTAFLRAASEPGRAGRRAAHLRSEAEQIAPTARAGDEGWTVSKSRLPSVRGQRLRRCGECCSGTPGWILSPASSSDLRLVTAGGLTVGLTAARAGEHQTYWAGLPMR